jgi:hypothetical protein
MADPMSPSLSESAGAMKAAMAAFQIKARSQEKEVTPHSQLSARELAMKNLSRKGVVTPTEARSVTGGSQHGAALRSLQAAGIQDEALKVVPNWKMTDAQKRAAAAKAEIRGSENQAAAAMAKFGGEVRKQVPTTLPKSFVPVVKTAGGGSGWSTPRAYPPSVATPRTMVLSKAPPASRPHVSSGADAGGNTMEVTEVVERDLALLIAAFPRLGTTNADGSISTTFGRVVDDEELEQQLESLVGTLKAGRKRGLLAWEGQILLKGPHDGVPVKYVGDAKAAPTPVPVTTEPAAP